MRCQRCGKEISPLRQLTDREFCGVECRRRGPRASASELRDVEFNDDPFWEGAKPVKAKSNRSSNASVVGIIVGSLVVLFSWQLWMPAERGTVGGVSPIAVGNINTRPNVDPDSPGSSRPAGWMDWLQAHMPGDQPVRLRMELGNSLKDWQGGAGWTTVAGAVKPGRLRLWEPTLNTRDYDWQFVANIEKKGLGWVFRARNSNTYYATKLVLSKPGEVSGASIVRYGMDKSERFSKTELPLPVVLNKNQRYRISVVASGERFRTLIDGHVIDEWRDTRLKSGGVGLFTEEGDSALVDKCEFREQKGLLSRWLSAALWMPPDLAF